MTTHAPSHRSAEDSSDRDLSDGRPSNDRLSEKLRLPMIVGTLLVLLLAFLLLLLFASPVGAEAEGAAVAKSIEELEVTTVLEPQDAAAWYALANAWGDDGRPEEALEAAEQAVALEPRNTTYLHGRARHANWAGHYAIAIDSFRRILVLDQGDQEAYLGRARSESWNGQLDAAVEHYRILLERWPEHRQAWLELARCQVWRGDSAAAIETLDRFVASFGDGPEARRERARALAVPRPRASLDLLTALLVDEETDLDLRGLEPLALARSGHPREALDRVDRLILDGPGVPSVESVARVVTTPLRTTLSPRFDFYRDGDSVERSRMSFEAAGGLGVAHRWRLELDETELSADRGSGLAARRAETIRSTALRLGGVLRPWADLQLRGEVGEREIDGGGDLTLYRLALRWEPGDTLALDLARSRDLHDVSPRAVELEVARTQNRLALTWRPTLRHHVELWAAYDTFSDLGISGENERWEVLFAPRRQVLRRSHLNLDLGLEGRWMGFDFDPGSGYWAPEDYRRYALTGFGYWKMADDHGVSFNFALGWFRDDAMADYRFGGDIALEGYFGIYRDWQLRLRAAYSENARQPSGAFWARSGSILLTRRFG